MKCNCGNCDPCIYCTKPCSLNSKDHRGTQISSSFSSFKCKKNIKKFSFERKPKSASATNETKPSRWSRHNKSISGSTRTSPRKTKKSSNRTKILYSNKMKRSTSKISDNFGGGDKFGSLKKKCDYEYFLRRPDTATSGYSGGYITSGKSDDTKRYTPSFPPASPPNYPQGYLVTYPLGYSTGYPLGYPKVNSPKNLSGYGSSFTPSAKSDFRKAKKDNSSSTSTGAKRNTSTSTNYMDLLNQMKIPMNELYAQMIQHHYFQTFQQFQQWLQCCIKQQNSYSSRTQYEPASYNCPMYPPSSKTNSYNMNPRKVIPDHSNCRHPASSLVSPNIHSSRNQKLSVQQTRSALPSTHKKSLNQIAEEVVFDWPGGTTPQLYSLDSFETSNPLTSGSVCPTCRRPY